MLRLGAALGLALAISVLAILDDAVAQQVALDRIKRTGVITVCADPDRLPYSSEKPSPGGFDLEFAEAIAAELGFKLGITWHSTHRGTKIVRQLADGNCDFFPGFPVDASFEEHNFRVILSKPYYASGFATLTRADAPETVLLDSKSKGVGVQMGTLPDFKLFDRGYERKLFRNTKEMIEAVKDKEIDAAVVPALEGGWELKQAGESGLKVLSNTEKDFVFPMAVGLRKADGELREMINAAIDKLQANGKFAGILSKYGMVTLAGTGGGVPPKSKADLEKEGGGDDDDDGPPKKDKRSDFVQPDSKTASAPFGWWSFLISPVAAEEGATPGHGDAKKDVKPGEDPGADLHGIALSREFMVDPKTDPDFPADEATVDKGRKLYKQACYKCHGPNGVSGGTIPDLRSYAAQNDHYGMFAVIQAGRLERGMPAWNDYLTVDEIKGIVVYVKSLHKK